MANTFTWERAPFNDCPNCGKASFGILGAGGVSLQLRCTACRYSHRESLPAVSKKVIYLDQFALSALFQIERKGRSLGKHQAFWEEAHRLTQKLVLLQQIVMPHSDIHHNETVVSPFAKDLRECYEHLGGDVRLLDTEDVEHALTEAYVRAYLTNTEPDVDYSPASVLAEPANRWLEDMRVSVNMDYSQFAEGTREGVARTSEAVEGLIAGWAEEKPSFAAVLEREQAAFGSSRRHALLHFGRLAAKSLEAGDLLAVANYRHNKIFTEVEILTHHFAKAGVPEAQIAAEINAFWEWPGNRQRPNVKIFSYLLAALARKVASGQKGVSPGFMNDARVISTYAPYLDAMFLDKECAALLAEKPLRHELDYRAQIFSYNHQDAFLAYLNDIEQATPDDVRGYAEMIYGVN